MRSNALSRDRKSIEGLLGSFLSVSTSIFTCALDRLRAKTLNLHLGVAPALPRLNLPSIPLFKVLLHRSLRDYTRIQTLANGESNSKESRRENSNYRYTRYCRRLPRSLYQRKNSPRSDCPSPNNNNGRFPAGYNRLICIHRLVLLNTSETPFSLHQR